MEKTAEDKYADYMAAAIDTIKEFVRNDVRSGGNGRAACLEAAHRAVKEKYKRVHGKGSHFVFRKENIEEIAKIFESIDGSLAEFITRRYLDCSRRQKVTQIGKVTAKGILEPALAAYGLRFRAVYQQHRAKVELELDTGSCAYVYLPYSRLGDGVLIEGIPDLVASLNGMIAEYGRYFEVSKRRKF